MAANRISQALVGLIVLVAYSLLFHCPFSVFFILLLLDLSVKECLVSNLQYVHADLKLTKFTSFCFSSVGSKDLIAVIVNFKYFHLKLSCMSIINLDHTKSFTSSPTIF